MHVLTPMRSGPLAWSAGLAAALALAATVAPSAALAGEQRVQTHLVWWLLLGALAAASAGSFLIRRMRAVGPRQLTRDTTTKKDAMPDNENDAARPAIAEHAPGRTQRPPTPHCGGSL